MDLSEMRELPAAELRSEITKVREKIWKLRFQAKGEPLENPGELRQSRRDLARMLTVLRQKELARRARTARKGSPVPVETGPAKESAAESDSGVS